MSDGSAASRYACAARARAAATRADAWVWTLQLRGWQVPTTGDDDAVVALHQTAAHLRAAADTLDKPNGLTTYQPATTMRSAYISAGPMVVGATVLGLTLSGLTMALAIGAWVALTMAASPIYVRLIARRGPHGIAAPETVLAVTAAELADEVTALIQALPAEHSPQRAKAQASLDAAAGWVRLTIAAGNRPLP